MFRLLRIPKDVAERLDRYAKDLEPELGFTLTRQQAAERLMRLFLPTEPMQVSELVVSLDPKKFEKMVHNVDFGRGL